MNINNTRTTKKEIRWICLCLFIFAMVVRGIYYVGFMDNPFFNYVLSVFDQINFDRAAIGFADGDIMAGGGSEKYSPLYKYFLGIIYWVFGRNFYAIWAIQFTIGAISSVFMFLVTIRFFNKWTGIICSAFYALYSPNIFYEGNLIRASLTEFLAIILFYYLLRYKQDTRLKYALLSGAFLSLLIQCRPNNLSVLPFALYYLYVIVLKKLSIKIKIKHVLIFLGIMVLVGAPLMVRTIIIHKRFVLYDASGPQVILAGNLPEYEGVGWDNADYIDSMRQVMHNDNLDSNKKVLGYVFKRFCSAPLDYVKLYGKKTYWFFNNYEFPSNVNYYLYQDFSNVLKNPLGNFSLLISLALIGIFITCKDYKKYLLIYFFLIGLTLSVIILYPTSRFRMPVVPFFMIFASYAFYYIFQKIAQKKVILPISCAAFVVLMVYLLKTPDVYSHKVRPVDFNNLASAYLSNESKYNLDKTEEYLVKSWNRNSRINIKRTTLNNDARLRAGKAKLYMLENIASDILLQLFTFRLLESFNNEDYKAAISYAKKTIELDYANVNAHRVLSHCYLEYKDYVNAVNEYKICVIIEPQSAVNYYNLFGLFNNYLKDSVERIKYLQKALDIEPDILRTSNSNWNAIEKTLKRFEHKIQQNIELNHDKIEVLWSAALEAVKLGRFEPAVSNCEEILAIDYGNINAHNCLAYSYAKLERYEDSIAEYINMLTLDPSLSVIHYNLYELYSKQEKDSIKAMYHLEQSLKIGLEVENLAELKEKLHELKLRAELFREINVNDHRVNRIVE